MLSFEEWQKTEEGKTLMADLPYAQTYQTTEQIAKVIFEAGQANSPDTQQLGYIRNALAGKALTDTYQRQVVRLSDIHDIFDAAMKEQSDE